MTFKICKVIDGRPMWLKRHAPAVSWVDRAQAKGFKSKGDAVRAVRLLPATAQPVVVVEDASSK